MENDENINQESNKQEVEKKEEVKEEPKQDNSNLDLKDTIAELVNSQLKDIKQELINQVTEIQNNCNAKISEAEQVKKILEKEKNKIEVQKMMTKRNIPIEFIDLVYSDDLEIAKGKIGALNRFALLQNVYAPPKSYDNDGYKKNKYRSYVK